MLENVCKYVLRGFTVDPATFQDLGEGGWVTWAEEKISADLCLIIGCDDEYIMISDPQGLKRWLNKYA